MSQLKDQASSLPTRKMMAVLISGVVVALAQTLLETYAPDFPIAQMTADLEIWIQALVMIGFGYFTREKA